MSPAMLPAVGAAVRSAMGFTVSPAMRFAVRAAVGFAMGAAMRLAVSPVRLAAVVDKLNPLGTFRQLRDIQRDRFGEWRGGSDGGAADKRQADECRCQPIGPD
jgi:hypothetical protein